MCHQQHDQHHHHVHDDNDYHHLQQYHTTTTTTKKPTIQSFPYPPNTPTDPTLQPTHITHMKPWSLQWKFEVGR